MSTRPRTDYLFFIDWLSCPALIEIMVRATKALWVRHRASRHVARGPVTGTQLEQLDSIEPARCPRGC